MNDPDFIPAARVAALLGLTGANPAGRFLRRRAALEAQGFPLPMPQSASPLLWRRASVLTWIEAAARLAEQGQRPATHGAAANDMAHARALAALALQGEAA